jgi:hypothetical protein
VDDQGHVKYRTDLAIAQEAKKMDNDRDAPAPFTAPQPQLFASIIEGILGGTLEWGLFGIGILIALSVELAGVSALPFAVGMYLPISSSAPIFVGGLLRWLTDKMRGGATETGAEADTSPGVLLSSGYIAGGTLAGLVIAFFAFLPDRVNDALNLGRFLGPEWMDEPAAKVTSVIAFAILGAILFRIGLMKSESPNSAEPLPPGGGPDTRFAADSASRAP